MVIDNNNTEYTVYILTAVCHIYTATYLVVYLTHGLWTTGCRFMQSVDNKLSFYVFCFFLNNSSQTEIQPSYLLLRVVMMCFLTKYNHHTNVKEEVEKIWNSLLYE